MSTLFTIGVIAGCCMIYLPGYFLFRAASFPKKFSLAVSPILSIGIASILGIYFARKSQQIDLYWLFIGPAIAAFAIWLLVSLIKRKKVSLHFDPKKILPPLAYIAFSMLAGFVIFIQPLAGTENFAQSWDNLTHLSLIKNFSAQKFASPFSVSHYLVGSMTPYGIESGVSNFYPVAWHTLSASLVCLLNMSVGQSSNVANFIFGFIVFPLSFYAFLSSIFTTHKKAILSGALFIPAFAIFPYRLLTWTPCFPNLAGFALVPALALSFFCIFKKEITLGRRILYILTFIFSSIGIALIHPSAIFSAALLMIPFCIHSAFVYGQKKPLKKVAHSDILFATLTALACLILWAVIYKLPALDYVTSYTWESSWSPATAFVGALTFAFGLRLTQLTLGLVVLVGFVTALRNKDLRWLAITFLLTVIQYTITAGTDGPIKHFVAGFWYTDSYRIGGNVMIAAVPLASLGFVRILDMITTRISKNPSSLLYGKKKLIPVVTTVALLGLVFFPSFEVNGSFDKRSFSTVARHNISNSYNPYKPKSTYDSKEQRFATKAQQNNIHNQTIANVPFDGSAFAYPINSVNTLYRAYVIREETRDSRLIRTHLADIETNPEVLQAAKNLDIGFVMLLDCDPKNQKGFQTNGYTKKDWEGINSINKDTPGFTLISRSRDCQLYRVDAVAK